MAKKSQNEQPEQIDKPAKSSAKNDSKKGGKKDTKAVAKKNKKPGVFARVKDYFHNVRLEIKRSTWPTKSEVLNMSIIVVVTLLFFGILIFLIDRVMVMALYMYSQIAPEGSFYQAAADAASSASGAAEAASSAAEAASSASSAAVDASSAASSAAGTGGQ